MPTGLAVVHWIGCINAIKNTSKLCEEEKNTVKTVTLKKTTEDMLNEGKYNQIFD